MQTTQLPSFQGGIVEILVADLHLTLTGVTGFVPLVVVWLLGVIDTMSMSGAARPQSIPKVVR